MLLSLMLEHTAPKQIPPTSTTSLQNYSQDKQRAIENYSKLGTQHLYLSPSRALAAAKLLAEDVTQARSSSQSWDIGHKG